MRVAALLRVGACGVARRFFQSVGQFHRASWPEEDTAKAAGQEEQVKRESASRGLSADSFAANAIANGDSHRGNDATASSSRVRSSGQELETRYSLRNSSAEQAGLCHKSVLAEVGLR